jgi:hypothetical protein
VARHNDLRLQLRHTLHRGVEIIDLEPQQDAIAVWLVIRIANLAVVMFDIEPVQLKYQLIARDQAFILVTAVRTLAAK